MNLEKNINICVSKLGKRIWRYSLQYVGHFVPDSVCSGDVLHLCGVRVHLTTFRIVSYYPCSLGISDSDNMPEHGINNPWRIAPPEIPQWWFDHHSASRWLPGAVLSYLYAHLFCALTEIDPTPLSMEAYVGKNQELPWCHFVIISGTKVVVVTTYYATNAVTTKSAFCLDFSLCNIKS